MLPPAVLMEATRWSRDCDLMLAIGSSLVVTPAADLPRVAKERGARLVIINRDPTPLDRLGDATLAARSAKPSPQSPTRSLPHKAGDVIAGPPAR